MTISDESREPLGFASQHFQLGTPDELRETVGRYPFLNMVVIVLVVVIPVIRRHAAVSR